MILLSALLACAPHDPSPVIALITLDTFRADYLGAIGPLDFPGAPAESPTPHLDALAARGLLCTQGQAELPLTLPSHAAMLTGRSALELGLTGNHHVMRPDARTVAQELSEAGWRSGAFVSSPVLRASAGLSRGFEHYDDSRPWSSWLPDAPADRGGADTVDRALDWLDEAEGPSFLWVHLYDAHYPYTPPAPFDRTFDWTPADAPGSRAQVAASIRAAPRKLLNFVPRDIRPLVARYGGEIAWVDRQVGRLLAALPPEATVLVAGDHGESLVEHGYLLNHGVLPYQPSLRVPIILAGPGVDPAVQDAPVPLSRVAATLRQRAGLAPGGETLTDAPPAEVVSFATPRNARVALAREPAWLVAWRRGQEKWVVGSDGVAERYDLEGDPGERVNTAPADSAAALERGLALLERLRAADAGARRDEDPGLIEALMRLGYLD